MDCPGFGRLLTAVCTGRVGAVLALEASPLARNNRYEHQFIDLSANAGTLGIDHDGVYDPCMLNDLCRCSELVRLSIQITPSQPKTLLDVLAAFHVVALSQLRLCNAS